MFVVLERLVNPSQAILERLRLQRQQPNVMCTGWQWTCACQRHGDIFNRYQRALERDDTLEAVRLRRLVETQQETLARRS